MTADDVDVIFTGDMPLLAHWLLSIVRLVASIVKVVPAAFILWNTEVCSIGVGAEDVALFALWLISTIAVWVSSIAEVISAALVFWNTEGSVFIFTSDVPLLAGDIGTFLFAVADCIPLAGRPSCDACTLGVAGVAIGNTVIATDRGPFFGAGAVDRWLIAALSVL